VAGIEVVDPRYVDLLARARAVLEADPRVDHVDVGGSIASDTADEWSDLDLTVYVNEDDHDAVVAEWPEWLAKITPTLFAQTPIAPFIVNSVTDDGLTLDIAVVKVGWPPYIVFPGFQVGMLSGKRYPDHASAVEYAVLETLRGLAGPFITFTQRGEHVGHMTGCAHILGLLTTVMLAETGSPPTPVKQLHAVLTDEQRSAIAALPPLRATREDVTAYGLAVASETLRRARPLFDKFDLSWPARWSRRPAHGIAS